MRRFGSPKRSAADKRAAAMQYLVTAREPTARTLVTSYGIQPAEAQRLFDDEQRRREQML